MSKSVAYCTLIATIAVILVLTATVPDLLSDSNAFLHGFVAEGLLNVLGVILAITLASAGQMHLTLNQIEEKHNQLAFQRTRSGIKSAAYFLIALFLFAVVLVVAKPLVAHAPWAQSLCNGFALIAVLWNVLILISLTQGIFAIKPEFK